MSEPQAVKVGLFEAAFRDVDLPMGLRVESVHFSGAAVRLQKDPLRIEAADPGEVRIVVLESALADFISQSPPWGLKNISVRLADGKLHFEAVKTVLVDLKVRAVCSLRIVDESEVFIDLESVDVVGAGLKQVVQGHIDKLNPILTTAMLPIPARMRKIDLADGRLTLSGEVSPPAEFT